MMDLTILGSISQRMKDAIRYYYYCNQYTTHKWAIEYTVNRYGVDQSTLYRCVKKLKDNQQAETGQG